MNALDSHPHPALKTEAIAGLTTFLTMAYIVIVNPTILSTEGTGMPFAGVLTATVLVCVASTLAMGLYANLPFGVAPGMGLNAFFTFTVVLQGAVPWPIALGMVFWAGVLFLLTSVTPLREAIANAIPPSLRRATAAGIGLLLTFIGLQNAGFVAANPATLVGVGLPAIVTLMMTDMFDSLSTFVGVAHASGMLDEDGRPHNLRKGLIVDAWATLGAALVGSSPGTAYVESIAGVRAGGRSGRTAVVTALCFVPCLFIAPVAAAVPSYATAAVLIVVGVSMFHVVTDVDFARLEVAVPAFATLILIPLTFSITQGILWGFILHGALFVVAGRRRELSRAVVALALVSMALLVLEHTR
jgi:AGZA family xanthine/uracil permease-like MFS transporter